MKPDCQQRPEDNRSKPVLCSFYGNMNSSGIYLTSGDKYRSSDFYAGATNHSLLAHSVGSILLCLERLNLQ